MGNHSLGPVLLRLMGNHGLSLLPSLGSLSARVFCKPRAQPPGQGERSPFL